MKKTLLPILLLSLLFLSCEREQELKGFNVREHPYHCYNEERDPGEGELSPDCGGNCAPCDPITPDCSPNDNEVEYYHDTGLMGWSTYTIDNISCELEDKENLEFKGVFDGDTLKIRPGVVNIEEEYNICGFDDPSIYIEHGGEQLCEGNAYIDKENGKWRITLCNDLIKTYYDMYNNTYNDTIRHAKILCDT